MAVTSYLCPGCTAAIKTANPLPSGKKIRCPRCARIFAAVATEPLAPPAPIANETRLTANSTRDTKLAAHQTKETKLAAAQTKETKLAAAQTKATILAAAQTKETKLAAAPTKATQLAAAQAKETRLPAAQPKATKLAAAQTKETKLPAQRPRDTTLAPPPPKPAAPPRAPVSKVGVGGQPFRITCPKCQATAHWKAGSPPPLGKMIKCPRCAAVFQVPLPAAPRKAPSLPGPAPRPPALTARPVAAPKPATDQRAVAYLCPGCKARIRASRPLPVGTPIKCPGCLRPFAVPAPAPLPKAPAQRAVPPSTRPTHRPPGAPANKPTKLPGASPRPTKMMMPPAAPTRDRTAGKPPIAPRPAGRIACPACKLVLKIVGVSPVGKAIKCPRCARIFKVRPKGAPAPRPAAAPKRTAVAPKTAVERSPARDPLRPTPRHVSWTRRNLRLLLPVLALLVVGSVGLYLGAINLWFREIPETEWVTFAPPGAGCQVLMPGQPQAMHVALTHGPGAIGAVQYLLYRKEENELFVLTVSDDDARVPSQEAFDKFYAPVRDQMLAKVQGELRQETEIALGSCSGREFQAVVHQEGGGYMVARIYLVRGQPRDRLVILVAVRGSRWSSSTDTLKFFDSFTIGTPPQPAKQPRENRARIRAA